MLTIVSGLQVYIPIDSASFPTIYTLITITVIRSAHQFTAGHVNQDQLIMQRGHY